MRPRKFSIVCPELPLPVIPNFSTVLAPYGTTGHQILGILPKSESSNSNWWVGDIQIPENVHLIMTPPQPATMPYNFEVLVLVEKRKIAPPKSRILNYSFPPLRYLTTDGGGFFSPTNSQLVAMPFFDFQSFNIQLKNSPYLALSLLPNSHPLSNALSTNPSVPIPIIPKPIPMSLPILQPIPPNQLSQPVTPSPPLLPPSDDVSALVHSLGDFTAKYPGTPLFQLPDNFEITGVHPDHIRTFLGKAYPLILVPKSFPPSQDHLPLMGPPNHDESHQLWTDFQLVAKVDADPWTPPFFHPFVLVSARLLINLSENEVPLPIFINTTEVDGVTGNEILQVIMIRDPRQPPAHSYHVMCIVPKISRNTNSMTDVPESPAIYPSRIIPDNTTTTLPTNTETSTIAVTESGIRGNQHDSESEKKPKPLPSKKSWKNRLASYGVVEPSVKVIKREPTATGHSILISLFGL